MKKEKTNAAIKNFKLPIEFKKYCKNNLLFLGPKFGFKKVYNQCLEHYGKEILDQSIKELKEQGKLKKEVPQ